ncbi:MAG: hypothetical protein KAT68_04720 [Bacteroidales bacterium]|nr:hypothetical protein [Bacteroidales bacterium]
MKISGFTFVKNATKLYIPVKEAIESVLPICDEFIVALGNNDEDDNTLSEIKKIKSSKIKIINTVWETSKYPKNTVFAKETDIAKNACSGDWLFYIQSDEAVHEKDLPTIKQACEKYIDNDNVEGFLFKYFHFWGDFWHYHKNHVWYPKEIRIIKNIPEIHSWRDAQSFRNYKKFNYSYNDYISFENSKRLKVIELDAHIYHYGHARPPKFMSSKKTKMFQSYHGNEKARQLLKNMPNQYDYGPLNKLKVFKDTHPSVMKEWISRFNWSSELQYSGKINKNRQAHKHEKLKYRIISWIENNLLRGKTIGGFKNYKIIKT